jgi:ubiquinone/menaquinone biosynthesis C-methylase UbiE
MAEMTAAGSYQQKRSEVLFSAYVAHCDGIARKKAIHFVHEQVGREIGFILEVGCGPNPIGIEFPNKSSFVAIDISLLLLKAARAQDAKHSYEFVLADAEHLPFRSSVFAACVCINVLHHFPDPRPIAMEVRLVLQPYGKLVILEPNGSNPLTRLTRVISSLLPRQFIAMKGIASPNECVHTLAKYQRLFTSMGFLLVRVVSSYERQRQKPARYVVGSRLFLFDFFWLVLPQPLNGNELFLFFLKLSPHWTGFRAR